MKHSILLLLIALPLLLLIGCSSVHYDSGESTKEGAETNFAGKVRPDLIGINYYRRSGSMAGADCSYSISKNSTGEYLFHAELDSGGRIVDKKIPQEEFDAIMQIVSDNSIAQTNDNSATVDGGEVALDADSSEFEAVFADGNTQSVNFGRAEVEVISRLRKLTEE